MVSAAVQRFAAEIGAELELADPGFPDPSAAFGALVAMESDLTGMRQMMAEQGGEMSPHLVAMLQRDWRAENFTDAVTTRKAVSNCLWRFMQRFDLLDYPDAGGAAVSAGDAGTRKSSMAAWSAAITGSRSATPSTSPVSPPRPCPPVLPPAACPSVCRLSDVILMMP